MSALLPAPTATLFGRDEELATLTNAIVSRRARLVTLTGLGGSGKTRLAVEGAWQARGHFSDGAAFVDLSAIHDAALVADDLCRQLDIASLPDHDPLDRLCRVLADRNQLVVVDNFEQVLDAANVLASIAGACPGISLLVTSRRRLRLTGERVLPVPPLDMPAGAEDAAASAAVALYCDRAAAVDPGFQATEEAVAAVAEICRRLDGLPLAIELAAARSRTLPPAVLLSALASSGEGAWTLLDHGPVDGRAPQRSLFEAIGWSVDLLAAEELMLFRRLGVFRGAWSIDAAEAVCVGDLPGVPAGGPDGAALNPIGMLDALSALVDLHLVEPVRDGGDGPRYRFLDTIAAVARQLLARAGEQPAVQRRHADYFLEVVLAAGPGLESAEEASWYRRIDAESFDVQAALTWLAEHDRAEAVVRAAGALGPYWLNRGRFASGRRWLTLDTNGVGEDVRAVARGWAIRLALDGRAEALTAGRAAGLIEQLESVRAGMTGATDPRRWLRACEHLSYALRLYGDPQRAQTVTVQALQRCTSKDLSWWRAEHLLRLALLAEQLGDLDAARERAREAAAAARAGGNERVRTRAIQASVVSADGIGDAAMCARVREVLALSARFGDRRGAATSYVLLGATLGPVGRLAESGRCFVRAISESTEIGYQHGVGLAECALVMQAAASGEWTVAATLHGSLLATLPTLRRQLTHRYAQEYDAIIRRLRAQVGGAAFDAVLRDGALLSWEQGTDFALAWARTLAAGDASPCPADEPEPLAAAPVEPLSPREREVLALIAQGKTNQQIAGQLFLSPKTVMHHSGHLYRKLGVRGRAEAVACAARSGLLPRAEPRSVRGG